MASLTYEAPSRTDESSLPATTRQTAAQGKPTHATSTGDGSIHVRVAYFGMPLPLTGTNRETVELSAPARLSALEAKLVSLHPGLEGMFPLMLPEVNGAQATGDPQVYNDSEVDVLSYVTGG